MRHITPLFVVLVASAAFSACGRPAEERARLDLDVGRAHTTALDVAVDDGLASVRATDGSTLRLWAQAPTLRFHVTAHAAGTWTIAIDNALADATLTGEGIDVRAAEDDAVTRRRWTIDLPAEQQVTLSLHAPDENDSGQWRFAFLSDVQEAIDRVGDIFARMNADPSIRFVLSGGDLTDRGTPEELDRFQRELRALHVPFYATAGNHDIATSESLFRETFGRGNESFVFRGVEMSLLDSASATIDPGAYDMLDGWLGDGRNGVHVVTMHIPPLDPVGLRNAAFASHEEAAKLLEKLARGNVDLALYGHIHSYYELANAGIPSYVSGGGGAHPETMDNIGRHYLTIDLDAGAVNRVALVPVSGD